MVVRAASVNLAGVVAVPSTKCARPRPMIVVSTCFLHTGKLGALSLIGKCVRACNWMTGIADVVFEPFWLSTIDELRRHGNFGRKKMNYSLEFDWLCIP